ncbi:Gfo/Idh/MocA family protein [Motiliproteus sp. MSK22-1]|uniref:Gfo/Idh/MocA family protein n=1 Tax=Motiliproteus sp. MSK22-1 TaxID=1897630 RepID=UPI000977A304|nr:Gfo/Idh/MocA family oxidoreductase [Motiliproteus sp. MSK22-1]OMH26276.1 oxidoreductase [Motiliproteus sp. MSK22-1]
MHSNKVINSIGRRLRLGVVGGGPGSFIGSIHRAAAQLNEQYEVVAAVLSSDPERSLAAAASLGIARGYATPEVMMVTEAQRDDGIDVLAIMTPNDSHYELACKALEQEMHVICEKPLSNSLTEAEDLQARAQASDSLFCVAYGYSGYPMIRQARAMIEAGDIGEIRMLQCEYIQGHLAELTPSEKDGSNWHMDPNIAGPSLILGDIATHSYHLAAFVTGIDPHSLSADVTSIVPGRRAHDYTAILLRYANNARGMLWVTQAAAGAEHGLHLRVFGSKGGLEWHQEQPNQLLHRRLNQPSQWLTKGGPGLYEAANRISRVAIGHPEGYQEAFGTLYSDFAEAICQQITGTPMSDYACWYPGIEDGVKGVRFVETALASSNQDGKWLSLA